VTGKPAISGYPNMLSLISSVSGLERPLRHHKIDIDIIKFSFLISRGYEYVEIRDRDNIDTDIHDIDIDIINPSFRISRG